jgi:hypothetical protein
MRVVIDTNQLESRELLSFLTMSQNNRAVLTDFVAMEAYQPDADHNVLSNMAVLSAFPKRVIVLQGTTIVGALDPALDLLPDAMIDRDQTKGFTAFAQAMAAAYRGNPAILSQINERRGWAKAQLGLMLRDAPDASEVFADMRALLTDTQWTAYERNEPLSEEVVEVVLTLATEEADQMAALHPKRPRLPSLPSQLPNHFIWRLMLCRVLRVMRQVARGALGQKRSRFRNDMVDAFIAAYATYFSGLMTTDVNAMETHKAARSVLSKLGVPLARDYQDGTQQIARSLIDAETNADLSNRTP